ncbi:MAG: hypothetical protein HY244_11195 [Rhizobiales bacterium]|nr:hypothetical protein [Hyphomicrobiales bacterium]
MKHTLKHALVASITLGLASADALAQDAKGAPDVLIGKYGKSPEQCRSYHRKSDNMESITKTHYTFCGGAACEAEIVSHRKTKDGYVLRLTSRGNPDGWTTTFRQIDENIFEQPSKGRAPETLVRCTIKDAIAGIGREADGSQAVTQSINVIYSAFYAQAVPSACPDLRADQAEIKKLILVGEVAWAEHLVKYKLANARQTLREQVRQSLESTKKGAEYGVRSDAKEISDFCSHVLNAFGSDGSVIPNLITDPRKKA